MRTVFDAADVEHSVVFELRGSLAPTPGSAASKADRKYGDYDTR
ncbi:hypothetical protein [Mycolicibacterium agri]|nr:hypothetical protein [Mycolicibacterium agri]